MTQSGGPSNPPLASVKALVFDTFGTVVDWRTSVTQEVEELARRKGLTVDGAKFADAWRAGYGPSMNRVRTGELPWTKLDRLHRMTLDRSSSTSASRDFRRPKPTRSIVRGIGCDRGQTPWLDSRG